MIHNSGVSDVLIVGSCRAFTDISKHDELVLYENAINNHILNALPAEFVCCYAEPRLSQISPIRLASIMYHHTNILSGKSKELNNDTSCIGKIIKNTFDELLGDGCGDLIFKTMKLVYKLDQPCLFSEPGVFEKKLISMLGSKAAYMVFDILKKRLVSYLILCGDDSNVNHIAKERK